MEEAGREILRPFYTPAPRRDNARCDTGVAFDSVGGVGAVLGDSHSRRTACRTEPFDL